MHDFLWFNTSVMIWYVEVIKLCMYFYAYRSSSYSHNFQMKISYYFLLHRPLDLQARLMKIADRRNKKKRSTIRRNERKKKSKQHKRTLNKIKRKEGSKEWMHEGMKEGSRLRYEWSSDASNYQWNRLHNLSYRHWEDQDNMFNWYTCSAPLSFPFIRGFTEPSTAFTIASAPTLRAICRTIFLSLDPSITCVCIYIHIMHVCTFKKRKRRVWFIQGLGRIWSVWTPWG